MHPNPTKLRGSALVLTSKFTKYSARAPFCKLATGYFTLCIEGSRGLFSSYKAQAGGPGRVILVDDGKVSEAGVAAVPHCRASWTLIGRRRRVLWRRRRLGVVLIDVRFTSEHDRRRRSSRRQAGRLVKPTQHADRAIVDYFTTLPPGSTGVNVAGILVDAETDPEGTHLDVKWTTLSQSVRFPQY